LNIIQDGLVDSVLLSREALALAMVTFAICGMEAERTVIIAGEINFLKGIILILKKICSMKKVNHGVGREEISN
jgi:hypothetical protein